MSSSNVVFCSPPPVNYLVRHLGTAERKAIVIDLNKELQPRNFRHVLEYYVVRGREEGDLKIVERDLDIELGQERVKFHLCMTLYSNRFSHEASSSSGADGSKSRYNFTLMVELGLDSSSSSHMESFLRTATMTAVGEDSNDKFDLPIALSSGNSRSFVIDLSIMDQDKCNVRRPELLLPKSIRVEMDLQAGCGKKLDGDEDHINNDGIYGNKKLDEDGIEGNVEAEE